MEKLQLSICVPLYNEAESLPELYAWISKVMHLHLFSYELIFVDDGSTDNSWEIIERLAKENDAVKGIKFRRNYGKSAGLFVAFKAAQGDVVITMDADLQDSPDEIPELYGMIRMMVIILFLVIKKKDTTLYLKLFLQNYSILQPECYQV